jgi:hypothetical protein
MLKPYIATNYDTISTFVFVFLFYIDNDAMHPFFLPNALNRGIMELIALSPENRPVGHIMRFLYYSHHVFQQENRTGSVIEL